MSSKYVVTKYPPLPSKCIGCGFSANGERDFIDFMASEDFYGAIVLCKYCYIEGAALFDLGPVAEREARENVLLDEIVELRESNERLNHAIDSIRSVRPDFLPPVDLDESAGSETAEVDSGAGEEAESGTSESTSERGLEDLFESTNKRK